MIKLKTEEARHGVVCALLESGKDQETIRKSADNYVTYIMTGEWIDSRGAQIMKRGLREKS